MLPRLSSVCDLPSASMSSLRHFDLSLPVSGPPTSAALRVSRVRALRGPNYWRLAPVIACDVRLGDLEQVNTADVPGFTDRLLDTLPSLREHPCSREKPGGLVDRKSTRLNSSHLVISYAVLC